MNKTASYSVFKDKNKIRAALVKQEVKHTVYNLTSRPNFEQLTLGGGDFNTFLFKIFLFKTYLLICVVGI